MLLEAEITNILYDEYLLAMLAQVKEAEDLLTWSHISDYFAICLRFAIVLKSLLFHPLGDVDLFN